MQDLIEEELEIVEIVEFDDDSDEMSPAESAFMQGYEERYEEEDFWEID